MPTNVKLTAGSESFNAVLNDSDTAAEIIKQLPTTIRMSRWGDEYYGSFGKPLGVGEADDAREEMDVGELAYWPPGNALCIFFGPTPASVGDEPRAASAVNPAGRLTSDPAPFNAMGSSVSVKIELV